MKRILTGIKPTSNQIHIGNYFGALKNILKYQEDKNNQLILFIADLHTMTTLHRKSKIGLNTIGQVKLYLACGINPDKTLFFRQSDVPGNVQLSWVLGCITHLGYMKRMHAFKDAVAKGIGDEITVGTFNYPILMASDIILYDVDIVPVGKDQKQHIEFARDIAEKFNRIYGKTFKLPEAYIEKEVAIVLGIDGRKMSKSYNNYIGLLDDDQTILKKVKRIVTDNIPIDQPKDPDKCNVYSILKLFLTKQENQQLRNQYINGGLAYKDVKMYLYEKLINFTRPIKEKVNSISDEQANSVLKQGALRANEIAGKKLEIVYKNIGF